ncbi:MAG: DUF2520 domain-containing protein [Bryobacterales bacterium]|nr:DUF2520 domain-containing protein [Bryobacterales bacterium]
MIFVRPSRIAPMEIPDNSRIARSTAVGIAGTGRIAQSLGALLAEQGLPIAAIAGRDLARTREAAAFTGARRTVNIEDLGREAAVVLIAVSDDAIEPVAARIASGARLPEVVFHTCGSAGPELLQELSEKGCATGVLHPLQTVPAPEAGVQSLSQCYYAYCGEGAAVKWASRLIGLLSGKAIHVNPSQWALYHAAAVMACNYNVTLVSTALDLLEQAGVERAEGLRALSPILRNTTEILLRSTPEEALTGPIRRGDVGSVQRHLDALESAPAEARNLYRAAASSTIPLARRAGLSIAAAAKLAGVLRQEYESQ